MLKPQDCVILMKLLANLDVDWSQRQLAKELHISLSEVNAGIRRLCTARLLRKNRQAKLFPNIDAAEEFLVSGIKFFFPGILGEYTQGVPTAVATPLFHNKIVLGNEPIPVWPDSRGNNKGIALAPIHPSVPESIRDHPDEKFYELLALTDAIRVGRARERNVAAELLKEKLKYEK